MSETVVIVGAGIVGSALASILASSSVRRNIIVIDRSIDQLQGSTGHAPGFVGQYHDSEVLTRLAIETVAQYHQVPGGFEAVGGLEVAFKEAGIDRLESRCKKANALGLEAEMISVQQASVLAPQLVAASETGSALHFKTDGTANATRITSFYQQAAKEAGAIFLEKDVTKLLISEGRVTGVEVQDQGSRHQIQAERVVLATGIWAQDLCQDLDFPVPVIPVAHPYMHSGVREANPTKQPFVRWSESHVYARDHGDRYGIGTYNHAPIHYKPQTTAIGDWLQEFSPALEDGVILLPASTQEVFKTRSSFNGIFSMTPDNMPIAGKVASMEGLYMSVAVWVTHAAGTAKFIAKLIEGQDVEERTREALDPERFRGQDPTALQEQSLQGYNEIYKATPIR